MEFLPQSFSTWSAASAKSDGLSPRPEAMACKTSLKSSSAMSCACSYPTSGVICAIRAFTSATVIGVGFCVSSVGFVLPLTGLSKRDAYERESPLADDLCAKTSCSTWGVRSHVAELDSTKVILSTFWPLFEVTEEEPASPRSRSSREWSVPQPSDPASGPIACILGHLSFAQLEPRSRGTAKRIPPLHRG